VLLYSLLEVAPSPHLASMGYFVSICEIYLIPIFFFMVYCRVAGLAYCLSLLPLMNCDYSVKGYGLVYHLTERMMLLLAILVSISLFAKQLIPNPAIVVLFLLLPWLAFSQTSLDGRCLYSCKEKVERVGFE
jgi:hypothetical protein